VGPKYTLEAALTVRRARTDAQSERRAAEAERVRKARLEIARLEDQLRTLAEARRAMDAEQVRRLEEGVDRAWDLAAHAENRRANELWRNQLVAELERAHKVLTLALEAESAAARDLGKAFSEQRAVERHRESWQRARATEQERADDDQAMEAWQPDRVGSLRR
jgi:colicin import membrane protein